jgi:hypothetical protein
VQESGSFQTTQKVPKKSDFLEKSDFSNRVPKHAQKMKKKSGAQEILFFGKIGFLKCAQTCPKNEKERCPRNPIFGKNKIFKTVPKRAQKMKKKSCAQEILFFGKIGFLKPCA